MCSESAYNSLIIGPRGLQCETNLYEIMGWESSGVVRFDLGPLFQYQTRIAKLKSAYYALVLVLEVCNVKPNYRKNMGWESSEKVRFGLGPLLQGQTMVHWLW